MSASTDALNHSIATRANSVLPTGRHLSRPPQNQKHDRHDRNNVRNSLIAGSLSGILSTAAMYPMDVLRTKMQMTKGAAMSPWKAWSSTVEYGGFRALYTGMALPLAAQAVYKATVFTINNVTQNAIVDFKNGNASFFPRQNKTPPTMPSSLSTEQGPYGLSLLDRFVCGFVGGAVNGALFVTPVEFVRNQMIAQHSELAAASARSASGIPTATPTTTVPMSKPRPQFTGSWDVIVQSFRKKGILSLWRGTSWSVARDGIGCGFFFYTVALVQRKLTPLGEKPSFPVVLFSGGLAGLSYWVVALPMDSVKTWIQSSSIEAASISVKDAIRKIYLADGVGGVVRHLNRGWQVAYGRGIPSSAITITTYSIIYDRLTSIDTS